MMQDKDDGSINISWFDYLKNPEMKKHLKNVRNDDGTYVLVDTRTNKVIISSSMSLHRYLK